MSNPNSAGYVVTDNELIHGVGATAKAAWADMLETMKAARIDVLEDGEDPEDMSSWTRASGLTIRSASAGLLADVAARGGDVGWHMRGGVACTREEADAE